MTNQKTLRKILNSVGSAALIVGLSLSPVGLSAALANSPGAHGGSPAMEQNSGMGQNESMSEGNMSQESMSEENMPSDMRENANGAQEQMNSAANSRPMVLRDFMNSLRNGTTIANAERSDHQITIEYSDGWQEEIVNSRYEITDPSGNVIISRPAVQRDFDRLNSAF
ncbi:hypothetical protein MNBD_ALPHA11-479 [hydrothermal vent metagenome]|uniref:Uncharacterized protein n=1 Tax=hydrothermal vent metagenome TaxID=652676 RepID=A0A3B0UCC1_9ZZZZ